jgi:hypothetical protein
MFRRILPAACLLVMWALGAAPSAQAADVVRAAFTVTVSRSTLGADDIDVEFRVSGTGLNDGTLTQPITGAAPIAMTQDGADLVITDTFANEGELTTFLPSGNYVLRLNGDAIQATLVYARPAVPSPAISAPTAGGKVPPGAVEVVFTACAVCNLSGDSVAAELLDGAGATLDDETLTASATRWTPQGNGGALALPEDSQFVARVAHTALREATTAVSDDDGSLVFAHAFAQADEVDFETGFSRPAGHVCIAANYAAAPQGCAIVNDAALQVLDTSGVFATQIAGHDVALTLSLAANGALRGSATADLDDDGPPETSTSSVKGRLTGKKGALRSQVAYALRNPSLSAKLEVKLRETLSIAGNTRDSEQRASGKIGTTKIKETATASGALPFAAQGWLLEFDVDAQAAVDNGVLTLAGGRSFPLTGKHKFKLGSGLSSVKLRSAPKGIRIELSRVTFDDATSPLGVGGGSLRPRILGQSARVALP